MEVVFVGEMGDDFFCRSNQIADSPFDSGLASFTGLDAEIGIGSKVDSPPESDVALLRTVHNA